MTTTATDKTLPQHIYSKVAIRDRTFRLIELEADQFELRLERWGFANGPIVSTLNVSLGDLARLRNLLADLPSTVISPMSAPPAPPAMLSPAQVASLLAICKCLAALNVPVAGVTPAQIEGLVSLLTSHDSANKPQTATK